MKTKGNSEKKPLSCVCLVPGDLASFELQHQHRDDEEQRDPGDRGYEAHVHVWFHYAPAAGQYRTE